MENIFTDYTKVSEDQLNAYLLATRKLADDYEKRGKKNTAQEIINTGSRLAILILETAEWNKKPFKCLVCNQEYKDLWYHLTGQQQGLLNFKDKNHNAYYILIERSWWKKPCFCGGHITIRGTGEESWETTCDNCDFLYDED